MMTISSKYHLFTKLFTSSADRTRHAKHNIHVQSMMKNTLDVFNVSHSSRIHILGILKIYKNL